MILRIKPLVGVSCMMSKQFIYLLFSVLSTANVMALDFFYSEEHDFTVETLVTGLENPWSIDFMPDGKILIVERSGRLRIFDDSKLSSPLKGLPRFKAKGQGGLLDIALDPDFIINQILYLSYSGADGSSLGTEVVSAKLVGDQLTNLKILFKALPKSRGGHHFGSRLLITKTGELFITLGDRGDKQRAQNTNDHAGSLIRINKDGTIPKDNPFVDNPSIRDEIYTYGNRNMQGIAMHPETNDIWTIEHGPQGGDELNLMKPGINYGWPVITYGVNYVVGTKIGEGTAKATMAQPIHYWVPSIATSSLLFYTGNKFSNWQYNAFVSSLVFGQLARLKIINNKVIDEERLLNGEFGRIREVHQGLDGFLYFITDDSDGSLFRIKPVK